MQTLQAVEARVDELEYDRQVFMGTVQRLEDRIASLEDHKTGMYSAIMDRIDKLQAIVEGLKTQSSPPKYGKAASN